jgi:hypothetical protein
MSAIRFRKLQHRFACLNTLLDVGIVSVAPIGFAVCASIFLGTSAAVAENGTVTPCPAVVSADQRLQVEHWAIDGHCASPVRTRVTDRYLGFMCTKGIDAGTICRPRPPTFDSKPFRSSRLKPCFDAVLTPTEGEFVVNRVREWVTTGTGKCVWDPEARPLSVEMDLENARVCIEDQCIPITRLSVVGRLRLVRTLLKAFNQPS